MKADPKFDLHVLCLREAEALVSSSVPSLLVDIISILKSRLLARFYLLLPFIVNIENVSSIMSEA